MTTNDPTPPPSPHQGGNPYGAHDWEPVYDPSGAYRGVDGYSEYPSGYDGPPYRATDYPAPPYGTPPYGTSSYGTSSYGPSSYAAPPAPPARRSRRRGFVGAGSVLVAAGLVAGGVALVNPVGSVLAGSGSVVAQAPSVQTPAQTPSVQTPTQIPARPGSGNSTSARTATAKQQVGIVTVVSVLKYQNAESAGTGMVLSSNGKILTNNHVINGSTSITVTVETTGKSYRADVVGTSPTNDVAVLQLRNASGLPTAKLAKTASSVSVGDAVIGVGNAGGTGTLTAASGQVTGLNRSITASDESGQDAERLTGLIETDAPIISGDSGGPLYAADGSIVGMNTAASASRSVTDEAYAIPVDKAVAVADEIESGIETTTIHIGLPGFMGISTRATTGGVGVTGVLNNGPADDAGVTGGSVITAVDGTRVTTAAGLKSILGAKKPGSRVSVSWTDANGTAHTANVTLMPGPAD